jgi:hypothetical protein
MSPVGYEHGLHTIGHKLILYQYTLFCVLWQQA